MAALYRIEALSGLHDRMGFRCGVGALDRYLSDQANQDVRRRVAKCFVVVEEASNGIAGYYTLAATSLPLAMLPDQWRTKLPRYPVVPAALIGRLAGALPHRARGLGSALIVNAIKRIEACDVAAFAIVVQAKDERAKAFYEKHSFEAFRMAPQMLFLPLASARRLMNG